MHTSFNSNGVKSAVAPWKQLLLEIDGLSVGGEPDHDSDSIEFTGDVTLSVPDIPTVNDAAERRYRISAWVADSNKPRKCSESATARNQGRRARNIRNAQAIELTSAASLPSRPDLMNVRPTQAANGDRLAFRPLFSGSIARDNDTKEEIVFRPTDEDYAFMDMAFSIHVLHQFRELAGEFPLLSITEAMLTEGHWMSDWWCEVVHDLPRSCETLADLLEVCHPAGFRQTH